MAAPEHLLYSSTHTYTCTLQAALPCTGPGRSSTSGSPPASLQGCLRPWRQLGGSVDEGRAPGSGASSQAHLHMHSPAPKHVRTCGRQGRTPQCSQARGAGSLRGEHRLEWRAAVCQVRLGWTQAAFLRRLSP